MNAEEQFASEREERLRLFASDPTLNTLAHDWIFHSMQQKYLYNFDWLGRPIIQYPEDMVAVQELIWTVRPTLIIETGIAHGGSLVLSASIARRLCSRMSISIPTTRLFVAFGSSVRPDSTASQ